jgi:hypothetical protein
MAKRINKSQQPKDNKVKYVIGADVAPINSYYGLGERTLMTLFKIENGITYVVENSVEPNGLLIPERKGWFEKTVKEFSEKFNNCQIIEVVKDID